MIVTTIQDATQQQQPAAVVTDILQYIPFSHLTRMQVAELVRRSPSAVDYYVTRGYKVCEGHHVMLKRQRNGTFITADVLKFIKEINNQLTPT